MSRPIRIAVLVAVVLASVVTWIVFAERARPVGEVVAGAETSPTSAPSVLPTVTAAATVAPTLTPSTTVPPTSASPTTTVPAIDTSVLADVIAGAALGPVPEGTPVRSAGGDEAPVYQNGCHASWGATAPKKGCFYGDTSSNTLVVFTGDSEAAHWFGAFDEAGKANGWKIAIVTKAGCPAADVKIGRAHV